MSINNIIIQLRLDILNLRSVSLFRSRFAISCLLSYSFLPFARPISTFALLSEQLLLLIPKIAIFNNVVYLSSKMLLLTNSK